MPRLASLASSSSSSVRLCLYYGPLVRRPPSPVPPSRPLSGGGGRGVRRLARTFCPATPVPPSPAAVQCMLHIASCFVRLTWPTIDTSEIADSGVAEESYLKRRCGNSVERTADDQRKYTFR
ncbi:hypothetical protein GCM10009754_42990 [Amycolatopsis minnesotensis]|uniref:Uncharacterized protein n=1 Tax=Amycolatopsis minnesotensis TaxID=337894 RepID=A0ABP5CM87_9PSEU